MKIYTKNGDSGETSLLNGQRVPKDHPHLEALGSIDECNSHVGFALSFLTKPSLDSLCENLLTVQKTLLEIGAALSSPLSQKPKESAPEVQVHYDEATAHLEEWIDEMDDKLSPLRHFILTRGHSGAASLHIARTVCRRAERHVLPLLQSGEVDKSVLMYLNRLSDFLFVSARHVNTLMGTADIEWK